MDPSLNEQLQSKPLATVAAYYARCLPENSKALNYLRRNALFCDESESMQVGFADRTLGKHIPSRTVAAGRRIRQQLEALGVYRPNGREHFRGMVTVPLTSPDGQVTGLYGRRLNPHGAGPVEQQIGRGIFNAAALTQREELIITETVVDAWAVSRPVIPRRSAPSAVSYCPSSCPTSVAC